MIHLSSMCRRLVDGVHRLPIWLMLAAGLSLLFARGAFAADELKPPRGVVVFIADDQGENDAGCYGNDAIRTPNIDRLAAEGMRFDWAFLTTSSCSPSRSSILTGRYPHNTAAEDLHTPLPTEQKTLAAYLRSAGFYCAAVGKWHLGNNEKRNWDLVRPCGAEIVGEQTIAALRDRPKDKPFFFWVASTDPHRPYKPNAVDPPHDPTKVRVPAHLPDHATIRRDIALYYDEITRFDLAVGRVMDELTRQGVADDTLVFYLSDNGMPFPRAKTTVYDSGVHTPFIVRWPNGLKGGGVQKGLVSSIDLSPTVLDLVGIEQDSMQGSSLRPMLLDEKARVRDRIFAEANWHDYEQFTRSVRTERYRLVRNYYWDRPLWHPADSVNSITWLAMLQLHEAGDLPPRHAYLMQAPRPFEELYDLQADPHEFRNLADDPAHREELWRLRTMLDNWRVETNDHMPEKRRADGFTRDGKRMPSNSQGKPRTRKQ